MKSNHRNPPKATPAGDSRRQANKANKTRRKSKTVSRTVAAMLGAAAIYTAQPAQPAHALQLRNLFGSTTTSLSSLLGFFTQPLGWWGQPAPAPTPTPTPTPAPATLRKALKVLVIAVGDQSVDPGRAMIEPLLKQMGTPYDVLDVSKQSLTAAFLEANGSGKYNGIILTNSETYLPGGGAGLDVNEFTILQDYERKYKVRESVLSGFPGANLAGGYDYGMAAVSFAGNAVGKWTGAAGGKEVFEYINTANPISVSETYVATPRQVVAGDLTSPTVEPLLVDASNESSVMLAKLTYPDGREVLLSCTNQAWFFLQSKVMGYEFVNFATSGVFIGGRRAYLEVHNDDMFLPDEIWNPETNSNFDEEVYNYRISGEEIAKVVDAQNAFHQQHPLASAVITDIAFNAVGASATDPLTQALQQYGANFGFINHTFEAKQMDRLCPVEDNNPACPKTDYRSAYDEIDKNARAWQQYGFPDANMSRKAVLTDSHSGLSDRKATLDTSDDTPFPAGFNTNLGRAAVALGVKMLASDHSRQNQDIVQRVPNFNLVLMPRYPTSMFYNTATPAQLVSEYNYIFHDRYVEMGQDPCQISGAICQTRTYEEILASEAEATVRHILSYEPFPHYFHQPNLHTYDDAGHILQFDWQDAVLSKYEELVNLPLESPRFDELADLGWDTVRAQESGVSGYMDLNTNKVTITASKSANVMVTGIAGGETYGGQSQRTVAVSTRAQTFDVDRALDR